jgi:hypothetical protein
MYAIYLGSYLKFLKTKTFENKGRMPKTKRCHRQNLYAAVDLGYGLGVKNFCLGDWLCLNFRDMGRGE